MVILDLHYEDRNKAGSIGWILGLPIVFSLIPQGSIRIPFKDREVIKESLKNPKCFLGQQGLNHKCQNFHKYVDPWHENYCLFGNKITKEKQREFMIRGKELLFKIYKREAEIYTPPNHLWNQDTLEVAEQIGYKYLTDKNMINLQPYKVGKLIIVPEHKFNNQDIDSIVYAHYGVDIIDIESIKGFKMGNFKDIKPVQQSYEKIRLNEILKHSSKIGRDLKNINR